MYLFGTTVMRVKGVINARIAGLRQGIESAVAGLLEQHPFSDNELIPKLIERLRLEPVEIPPVDWKDRSFHIAQAGSYGLTETFYAFNRDVPYSGTTELWRYRPPRMFDVMLKAKFAVTGEVAINGLCTDAERLTIDRYLQQQLAFVRAAFVSSGEMVVWYNNLVEQKVREFVRQSSKIIAGIREEHRNK